MDVDVPLFSPLWQPSLLVLVACPCLYSSWSGNTGSYLLAETRLLLTYSLPQRKNNNNNFLKKRSTSRLLVLFLNGDVRHLQAITSAWRCQGPCGNDGVINSRLD